MPIQYQPPDLLGSYNKGQQQGMQNFSLGYELMHKEDEKRQKKDLQEAMAELPKSVPELWDKMSPEERVSLAMTTASSRLDPAGASKRFQEIFHGIGERVRRAGVAKTFIPDTVPGQVGTQTVPGGPAPESNVEAFPPDVEQSVMGQVPNPDLPYRELLASGDKSTLEILKLMKSKDYETHVTRNGDVVITDKTTGRIISATPASQMGFAEQGDKSQTEEQLTRKALGGDKQAQSVLDAMQARKLSIAKAGASAQQEAKMEGMDLNSLASSMKQGQMVSEHVRNAFGVPIQGKVETIVRKELPNFDFIKNDANAKWQYNPGNQRTIAMTEAALPRLLRLDEQVTSLGNTTIPKINEVMRIVARETGRPEYTNFEANRNAIVQEINTALSGSATSSDMRIRIELENIQSARSPAQLSGAIHNLREALLSRLDTSLSVPYPMEVVRGEKTLPKYKEELFKKYRGNYRTGESNGGPTVVETRTLKDGTTWDKLSDGTFKQRK